MKLVASLVIHNELDRYLVQCVERLLEACDLVAVHDDASTDGGPEVLMGWEPGAEHLELDRVRVQRSSERTFWKHEGYTRQLALDWTLEQRPTHILAVDADELLADPARLRREVRARAHTAKRWSLVMYEVWAADPSSLYTREDGGWRHHPVNVLYAAPHPKAPRPKMADKKLGGGRVPREYEMGRATPAGSGLLHFGWTRESERAARHQRYVEHDGGAFHASKHLDSIMWPDDRVKLAPLPWPAGMDRAAILDTVYGNEPAVTATAEPPCPTCGAAGDDPCVTGGGR